MNVYTGAGRKRVRKSTGTGDKVKARIIEQSVVAANKHITSKQRALAIIDNVMPAREKSLALYEAPEFYRRWARDEGRTMAETSLRHRVSLLVKFAVWAHDNTQIDYVEEVDATIAFAFAKSLPEGLTAKSKNDYIGDLGTAWKLYMRHDKAKENPWPNVRFQRNRSEERTGRAFTHDETKRLIAAGSRAGHDWATAMMIALYTGLRYGDATTLKWSDIDLKRRLLVCRPSKTKRMGVEVRIPLHDTLAEWLEAHRNDSDYITPGRLKTSSIHKDDKPFSQILQEAGVTPRDDREKLSFHCFRHTFVSRLAQAGVSQEIRMRLAGHTSAANHAIYTHDETGDRAAIDALEGISYTE